MRKHETHARQIYTNANTHGRSSPAEHEGSYATQYEPRASAPFFCTSGLSQAARAVKAPRGAGGRIRCRGGGSPCPSPCPRTGSP
eukprot:8857385-Pyramimonas_sp.AAC.1